MKIQQISFKSQIQTPLTLLEDFKQGKSIEYEHNTENDVLMKELDSLVKKYQQSMSIEDKKSIIKQEKKILLDGLKNPENTYVRNISSISNVVNPQKVNYKIEDLLRLFDITGLKRLLGLYSPLNENANIEDVEILKNAYLQTSENSKVGMRTKEFIVTTLSFIKKNNSELTKTVNIALNEMRENTKDEILLENIITTLYEKDINVLRKDFENNDDDENYLRKLLVAAKQNENKEIADLVTTLLEKDDITVGVYEVALLGAGKFRNDKNFEILKNIVKNKKSETIRAKELALQSLALYIKDKPEDVKSILKEASREKSIYGELAKILYDKVNGNYHNKVDREMLYLGLNKKQINTYNKNKKAIIKSEEPLNRMQQNAVDRFLLPFKKILGNFKTNNYKYIIQQDTFTKQKPHLSGVRYINPKTGIFNSGDFYDVFDGINSAKYSMMNKKRVASSIHSNQTGHELGHAVHRLFDYSDDKKVEQLYKNALDKGIELDYYAAANSHEYFAQGCEAYISIYKPHKDILYNNPLAHTKFELLAQDPDLYYFVKKCLKKYH